MRTTGMAFALACFVLAGLPVSADTLDVCRGRQGAFNCATPADAER